MSKTIRSVFVLLGCWLLGVRCWVLRSWRVRGLGGRRGFRGLGRPWGPLMGLLGPPLGGVFGGRLWEAPLGSAFGGRLGSAFGGRLGSAFGGRLGGAFGKGPLGGSLGGAFGGRFGGFVAWRLGGFFCGRRPLPFGGSHLRLPSGPAGIRTTTGSLSALARPTPYQLSHRVALVACWLLAGCWLLVLWW